VLGQLIASASASLDKIQALTDPSKSDSDKELYIKIIPDKKASTLTITDTGIGMTREDLANLGKKLQPGLHFPIFAAFIIANHLTITTRRDNDTKQYIWRASAGGPSTTSTSNSASCRGTKIVLHIKEAQLNFASETVILEAVAKYNNKPDSYRVIVVGAEQEWNNKIKADNVGESERITLKRKRTPESVGLQYLQPKKARKDGEYFLIFNVIFHLKFQ
jgi:molecular chaperone HtpG